MSVSGFEGAAGCGKTFALIKKLEQQIAQRTILQHERVLALTYMHGSRKRLSNKLSSVNTIKGRFDCLTVDSLAALVCRRWLTLLRALELQPAAETDYNTQCLNVSRLLQTAEVQIWFKLSYPFVIIDEAQDLCEIRTGLISSIANCTDVFLALDEFQCLNDELKPNPAVQWLHSQCTPTTLTTFHRTNDSDLLAAARAIREGQAPVSGGRFSFNATPGIPIAAAAVASAIAYGGTADIAIISPSLTGGFAQSIVERVITTACGKRKLGPYNIRWEQSDAAVIERLTTDIPISDNFTYAEVLEYWRAKSKESTICRSMSAWIVKQRQVNGVTGFSRLEIINKLEKIVIRHRQFSGNDERGFKAMTVHQAKNREFDGVIVLWPYTVAGDTDAKRRLLYNAVTRAKKWCKIFAQNQSILNVPPFT